MVRTINLDPMFVPVQAPEIEYNYFIFPGGELHIKLNSNIDYTNIDKVVITNRVNTIEDFFKILIAKDALIQLGIDNFDLIIPYLPYARQDRICDYGESFSLKLFSTLINNCNFKKVSFVDCHSNVGPALINNSNNITNHPYVYWCVQDIYKIIKEQNLILISPDAGASSKIHQLAKTLNWNETDIVQCDKTRDLKTGNITGFNVYSNSLKNKSCLIVDDICDGGGTFNGLANKLKELRCDKLFLFVTHGIFSKGFDTLNENFDKIFTTNSIKDLADSEKLKQYKLYI